jgi:predicted O-methyltransferase YrrM
MSTEASGEQEQQLWSAVDAYIVDHLVPVDDALEAALAASTAAGLPAINVAPNQGRFLGLLAQSVGARKILEIGTLGGYSSIWLGRALPAGGRLVTLEASPVHADVARANLARAGLAEVVEVRVGPALQTLPTLAGDGLGPFDMVFVDADKEHNPDYFAWAMKLVHRGSLIVVDNTVRRGAIVDDTSTDRDVVGTRRLYEAIAAEPRVSATGLQTVGSKGYDGFVVALVTADL